MSSDQLHWPLALTASDKFPATCYISIQLCSHVISPFWRGQSDYCMETYRPFTEIQNNQKIENWEIENTSFNVDWHWRQMHVHTCMTADLRCPHSHGHSKTLCKIGTLSSADPHLTFLTVHGPVIFWYKKKHKRTSYTEPVHFCPVGGKAMCVCTFKIKPAEILWSSFQHFFSRTLLYSGETSTSTDRG